MKLKEATERAGEALEAGDLQGVARALEARRGAIQSGETPSLGDFEAGERLLRALLELRQRAAFDSARLGQIQRYVDFRK